MGVTDGVGVCVSVFVGVGDDPIEGVRVCVGVGVEVGVGVGVRVLMPHVIATAGRSRNGLVKLTLSEQ